ncbi:GDP-mannose 4,6-dehydratase, partial [Chloroflexota bacterium]
YIEDVIRAYDLLLNHDEPITEPINFGSGREESILNLASMLIELCGNKRDIEPVHIEPRIGEVKQLIANATKAKNLLGWETECNLERGLETFVQWYRDYGFEERIKLT